MKQTLIADVRCPYTGSMFTLAAGAAGTDSQIEYGIVTSEAGKFPIVAGVLRLLVDDLQAPLVAMVERGEHDAALKAALEVPFLSGWQRTLDGTWRRATQRLKPGFAALTGPGKTHLHQVVTARGVSFADLARRSRADVWANWQTYRFSMPPFLPVYPLAHLAAGSRRIFDFGCGLAHSAFVMRRLAPQAEIVCADYSFTSMYLAKRYLVPDADCICLDGECPLPFGDGYFDCIFSTDALQYIEPKIGLAREFRRTLSTDGRLVLAHLHSRLSGVRAGKPLTPAGYSGLFDGMQRRLYPEDAVVADYFNEGTLRLDRQFEADELDRALNGISLVAANTDDVFRTYRGLLDDYVDAMRQPSVNPAYQAERSNGSAILKRTVHKPYAVQRDLGDCTLLPDSCSVEQPSIGTQDLLALRETKRDVLRELVRQLVVVDVPDQYL